MKYITISHVAPKGAFTLPIDWMLLRYVRQASLVVLIGESPIRIKPNQQSDTEPVCVMATSYIKPGVGKWRAITKVKVLSPEI